MTIGKNHASVKTKVTCFSRRNNFYLGRNKIFFISIPLYSFNMLSNSKAESNLRPRGR